METQKNQVLILGARGSIPVSGNAFSEFGGATTCVLVRLAGQYIVLDAGTGILRLPEEAMAQSALPLLLTHAHLDHINGLTMCPYALMLGRTLDIYSSLGGNAEIADTLRRVYSPPVWPVLPENLAVEMCFHSLPDSLQIGPVRIDTMEGVHPGGVRLIRLTAAGKSMVFATDCTLTDAFFPEAAAFAQGCDLLLCDGQYSEEEWKTRSCYGHNTWNMAAALGKACGAGQTRIIHHDPNHTDTVLRAAETALSGAYPACSFARDGEVIDL